MEIIVKTRFNCVHEKFEKFGGNLYLLYLPFEKDADSEKAIKAILSRKLGLPAHRITFKKINKMMSKEAEDWIFDV